MALDVERAKKDFPILDQLIHGHRLVYLDSASSAQKPVAVLDAMQHLYETTYANVHRGVYTIAEESTRLYEEARSKVAAFIGAASTREVIFGKNVTEAINLVAYAWGRANLGPGDAVLLTEMEHHANLVPWLQLKAERGIEVRYLGVDGNGELILDQLEEQLAGVKLVGLTLVSNVLGTLNPVAQVAAAAHAGWGPGAGGRRPVHPALHHPSGGTGLRLLRFHRPQGPGANRYRRPVGTRIAARSHADLPGRRRDDPRRPVGRLHGQRAAVEVRGRHPAPIAEAVGLGAAIDYLQNIGMADVRAHEISLTGYALESLKERHGDDLTIFGPSDPQRRGGVLSFAYKDIHPHDISQVLDEVGVCVRAGHHCAKPLMRRLGVGATARASLYLYNDEADVDALSAALLSADRLFS